MLKLLFLDYRDIETISGFTRGLEQPVKHAGNPLFVADAPWENGNMQLYGSVLKARGRPFQMWYSCVHPPFTILLAYAESADGLHWERPLFDFYQHEGQRTNILLANNPHGAAVIYAADDPREDWQYKMVAGVDPSGCIAAFHSADGIHWQPVRRFPILTTNPDCPMGFLRAPDGRYVIYHRLSGYGRRVFRSESWDFTCWTGEPRLVLEPDASDPPQVQYYGMGAARYGNYELGTLWIYHTDADDMGHGKARGYQDAELTYARSGYAWHRAAQGTPFIPHGGSEDWDRGNLQCASAPVFLDDEIRYYYMGTTMRHQRHWELEPQRAGLGLATLKPDRFVALRAGSEIALLTTASLPLPSADIRVNARIEPGGWLRVELLDAAGEQLPGYTLDDCVPLTGDNVAHPVRWRAAEQSILPANQPVRLRVQACNARLYATSLLEPGEAVPYHHFASARP